MGESNRIPNFDFLKILAMLMIVTLHLFFHGVSDLEFSGSFGTFNFIISQFIVIICSCCVNLFVLVSGFFLIEKAFNWRRITRLWIEVVFYAFGLSLLVFLFHPGVITAKELFQNLLPVRFRPYWFFQKYFGLVCLAPFLSKLATTLTQAQYKRLLASLFLICCTITMDFPYGNLMGAAKGFDLIWFIALFFYGGYFRRFSPEASPQKYMAAIWLISIIGLLFTYAKATLLRHSLSIEYPSYNGFGFLLAVPFFRLTQSIKIKPTLQARTICSLAPFTFGVYLISDHPRIREWLWHDLVDWTSLMNSPWFIPAALIAVLIIFLICIGIDSIRATVFEKCRINYMTDKCADKLSIAISHLIK